MALNKQPLNINFSQGLDTKSDPFQVSPGKFLKLENTVFSKGGLLQKRNGYGMLTSLPDATSNFATTFNGNLLAVGNSLQAYSQGSATWVNKGSIVPLSLSTLPLIRSNTNQTQADAVVASNGLICTVYTDNPSSPVFKYAIADSATGQNIVAPTVITPATGTVTGSPKVFLLGNHFVIVFTNNISGTYHLQYISISVTTPTVVSANVNISSQYTPATTIAFDGFVADNGLYLAWNGSDGGGAIRMTRLDASLAQANTVTFAGRVATIMSVSADLTGNSPIIYAAFYDSGASTGYVLAVNASLVTIHAPTQIISSGAVANITSSAKNGSCQVYYEVTNAYTYDGSIATNYIKTVAVTQGGSVGSTTVLVRSVGLASKSFILNSNIYFLGVYSSTFQPSYFLINSSGKVISQLAYSNAGGYCTVGLPSVTVTGSVAQVPYLIKDQIQAVNKSQGAANAAGVYSQLGINLASFTIGGDISSSAEIGGNLNIPAGLLWGYDGYGAVENGFFLWPDYIETTPLDTGGSMSSQIYYYIATYEWSDNQGNVFRSAPSIPVIADCSGLSSAICSVIVNVPTLRLTYKINNPVKIVLYRWSTAQQVYYQTTSINLPHLNDTSVDYLSILDINADSAIIGNNILYTTGGVIENITPPPSDNVALFQSRLFLIDSEDKNLLWFSKQVIETTPVEMSDLLTIYVAPTISAQGSTGPLKALSAMDDKLILFKKDAMYYINGSGPDNTGANSQFSQPIFITSTVGCDNQRSIVFMPNGLMFQSDKGVWLLGRDLSTNYIGAPVEAYTQNSLVVSAINVPGTNQVRFTLDSGVTLMYDYYYSQWGVFTNIPSISSTLYEGLHTYIDSFGQVFQETPGAYLDGAKPVLMNFTTSWLNLAGLQGYERAYFFYLLGTYISPHKLSVSIAYDYSPSPTQVTLITPDNYSKSWGGLQQWGSSPSWGGNPTLEQWRIFLKQGKCQSFQIAIQESFDASYGTVAGAGFTMSGLDIVLGLKKGYKAIKAAHSVG